LSGPENKGVGRNPRAVIFGCSGPVLSAEERSFFRDAGPLGFILFERNCENPDQVRALIADLRDCVGDERADVLIDQEGGRVARLKPPHWPAFPAAARFAALAGRDPDGAVEAAGLNARLIAAELAALGITVNCAPVLDIPHTDADPIIGDRAAGPTPRLAALLGQAVCDGLLDGGVLPVIKHLPGHGRAGVDSHKALPVVDASWEDLETVDFAPFRALRHMPWGMTAHVVYTTVDTTAPATTSAIVVETAIRRAIGFDGLLLSDDLSMRALSGDLGTRAAAALAAGCDVILHCNGERAEMEAVAGACGPPGEAAVVRLARGAALRRSTGSFDSRKAAARRDTLLGESVSP
jgi:beta-N-acetylhexosaminidase